MASTNAWPQAADTTSSDPPLEQSLRFRVSVGADGKLISATPIEPKLGVDIQRATVALLKELRIEPARSGGVAATSETAIFATVQFARQPDGSYKLQLKSARLATESGLMVPPRFPRKAHHASGMLVMGVFVNADGSVDPTKTRVLQSTATSGSAADQAELAKAASDALAQWKFKPDLVAGQPIATFGSVYMRFCPPAGQSCDSSTPKPSAEVENLPQAMAAGVSLPSLPRPAWKPASSGVTTQVLLQIAVDAGGKATVLRALDKKIPAPVAEAARRKLEATPFLPAMAAGTAVSSEMSVNVPVRDEGGSLHVDLNRVSYDFPLVAAPFPSFPRQMGANAVDARTRFLIVTDADGRADMRKSRVESIELSPNAPGIRKRLEANLMEAMRYVRVEPTRVDGKVIPISFVRGYYFCHEAVRACAFTSLDEVATKAMRESPTIPDGITLARIAP
jgi:hypothetical protein